MTDHIESPASTTEEPITQPQQPKQKSALRDILETALLAILIFVLVRSVVLNFRVDGSSMLPTMQNGEMMLVNRNAYSEFDLGDFVDWIPGVPDQHWFTFADWGSPSRGDVIVFTPPPPGDSKPYVKRVIGLPGDHVQITADNEVLVDGIALDEPYTGSYVTRCNRHCDLIVPDGHVFVMGDHRSDSQDSRYFGVVPVENIIGKAWIMYWPVSNIGSVDHEDYPELNP